MGTSETSSYASKYDWLENRKLRSVDQLRLWSENPRLDPEDKHVSLADYASDLIDEPGEKSSFLKLIHSIAFYNSFECLSSVVLPSFDKLNLRPVLQIPAANLYDTIC